MSVASGNPLTQQLNPHTQHLALPLHIQRLQRVLDVCPYLQQLEDILKENETKPLTQNDTKTSKEAQFNFANVTPEREWIKDLLLSDTEGSDNELTDSDKIKIMLELNYRKRQKWKNKLKRLSNIRQYQYISAGLLLQKDKYTEIKKSVALEKKKSKKSLEAKRFREETCNEVKKDERMYEDDFMQVFEREPSQDPDEYRSKLWNFIVKKEIPKMSKAFSQARHVNISNNKKIAVYCQREVRRWATKSQKLSKEANSVQPRARKVLKEVIVYWRKYEKVEKEARKKAEKEAQEQQKLYDEMREVSVHCMITSLDIIFRPGVSNASSISL
jgi:DNA helicase INO80